MKNITPNKKKLFNDPVYGFITVPHDLIFDLIEHPHFQRLRRIKQLGLTHLVYPGALHTRFHHAMGAMHLMGRAIEVIRSKGHEITEEEALAATIAILLHDIGHGPFSHALEYSVVKNVTHEDISSFFMDRFSKAFGDPIPMAIQIFRNEYPKRFLHQLVSSQLDMDRLDYLKRDSFFTGVSEGVISADRIISMLNVKDDKLCVEAKGIYSVEKFIIARRLMYWQVYLHKTVLSAENLVVNILKRAKYLALQGEQLFATPALSYFLYQEHDSDSFKNKAEVLEHFADLDDFDLVGSIKVWKDDKDPILATLCESMLNRSLYKIDIGKQPFTQAQLDDKINDLKKQLQLSDLDWEYFIFSGEVANHTYYQSEDKINILYKDGQMLDITEASDQLNISTLSKPVRKFFRCFPKHPMVNNLKNRLPK